jgi:hypothetical protein
MRRIGSLTVLLAGLLVMLAPGAASGAQTLGQTGTAISCQDNRPWVPVTDVGTYTAPGNGVLTSWSSQGGATANRTLKLMLLEPRGGNVYAAVNKDIVRTIAINTLNTFQIRLPIQSGQVLGLVVPSGQPGGLSTCAFGAAVGNIRTSTTLGEPALATPIDYDDLRGGSKLNVSAVLEPDVDCDGFGDESQDQAVDKCVARLVAAKVKGSKLKLSLTCPLVTQACNGNQVTLKTAKKIDPNLLAATAKAKRIPLGTASFSIPAGGSQTLTAKLGKAARTLFAARAKVKAKVTITGGGVAATQTLKVKRK